MTHQQLYREVMEVPLIFHWPGKIPEGGVIKGQVRLIDVAPTILDFAGIPPPAQIQGSSLRSLIASKSEAKRYAFSENPKKESEY